MNFIHKTISICNVCYRHIPGIVFEENDTIFLRKCCKEHGEMQEIVEIDSEFYYSLTYTKDRNKTSINFEATNKCQLDCPHCYHLPDNKIKDKPLDFLLEQISSYPAEYVPIISGAEPLLYSEIHKLSQALHDKIGSVSIMTNGVRLSDKSFADSFFPIGDIHFCFGLNHYSYLGEKTHNLQLAGINRCIDANKRISYIGYTLETLDHVNEVLEEINRIHNPLIKLYRIRCGSFIGRSSDQQRSFLSNLVKKIKQILGNEAEFIKADNNPYHVMVHWRGRKLRLIQWPDVKNIDMEELNHGPWADYSRGPITNFVHQVIMRDAFVNNTLPRLDNCPAFYHVKPITELDNPIYAHWKTNWGGPVTMTGFDYSIDNVLKNPLPVNTIQVVQQ